MKRSIFSLLTAVVAFGSAAQAQDPTSAIADLKNWAKLGLPIVAEWNVAGFTPTWHANQIRAAHRLLPSVFLPQVDIPGQESANDASIVTRYIGNFATDFSYLDSKGVPLCLRTNNICMSLGKSLRYRGDLVAASIPPSPLVWRIYNNALDDTPILDSLGPASNWTTEGTAWAKTAYMQKLQSLVKTPPYVVFVENNEWPYETGPYYTATKNATTGATTYAFRTPAEIAALSVRMRDHVATLSGTSTSPRALDTEIALHRRQHFSALYSAFNSSLTTGWQNKLYTAAYKASITLGQPDSTLDVDQVGYAPEALSYDAGSPPIYIDAGTNVSDFTSLRHTNILNSIPAWEWLRTKNPKAYREVSLRLTNGGALAGATAGKTAVITPARYEGWVQWLLWSIHDPGVPVILRHFCSSATLPTDPFFALAQFATLDKYGASACKNLKVEDYVRPLLTSVDRVCTNATLRKFWLQGQPVIVPGSTPVDLALEKLGRAPYPRKGDADRVWRVLEVNVNQTSSQWKWDAKTSSMNGTIKVWAVATRIGDQALIFAYTPCNLTGSITVKIPDFGTATIAAPQPWGYWLMNKGAAATALAVK